MGNLCESGGRNIPSVSWSQMETRVNNSFLSVSQAGRRVRSCLTQGTGERVGWPSPASWPALEHTEPPGAWSGMLGSHWSQINSGFWLSWSPRGWKDLLFPGNQQPGFRNPWEDIAACKLFSPRRDLARLTPGKPPFLHLRCCLRL